MRGKLPNAGHHAIAKLQTPQREIYVATQNIDELHQRLVRVIFLNCMGTCGNYLHAMQLLGSSGNLRGIGKLPAAECKAS